MDEKELIKDIQEKMDELEKNTNGNLSGVKFEKGKWVKLPGDEPTGDITVFELCELNGDKLIVEVWKNVYDSSEAIRKVLHATNVSFFPSFLDFAVEIERPDWAKL